MAYLALYRKYRPRTFDDIVGQDAVVTTLRNQVKFGQLGHAYLFCGTRGTGKTSAAKVFARAVNCEHPINGNPCNECDLCREAEDDFNVIEIDAASNNSVENIRDLRDEVQYTPARGKYKVYIIDEVHMLSTSAFNALLKTLEEPPEHVIFVLATTDPQKVLSTIISRCQRYDFKRITTQDLFARLKYVCGQEGIEVDDDALSYISLMADGGMRDALSILDQCHAYYIHERLTLQKAREVLGTVDDGIFRSMTECLLNDDVAGLLTGISHVYDDGRDLLQFVLSWNGYLRNLMVAKVTGVQAAGLLQMDQEKVEQLREQAQRVDLSMMGFWIEQLAQLEAQMKTVTQRRALLEIAVIRLVNGAASQSGSGAAYGKALDTGAGKAVNEGEIRRMERRVERLERSMQGLRFNENRSDSAAQVVTDSSDIVKTEAEDPNPAAEPVKGPVKEPARQIPADEDTQRVIKSWTRIRQSLIDQSSGMAILSKIEPEAGEPGTIVLVSDTEIFLKQLSMNAKKVQLIENAIADETGKRFKVVIGKAAGSRAEISKEITDKIHMDVNWR